MQRRIKFTHTGHSHLVGNFSAGDLFTGSPEACRHFVEEARCAEWADAPALASAPGPEIEQPVQASASAADQDAPQDTPEQTPAPAEPAPARAAKAKSR